MIQDTKRYYYHINDDLSTDEMTTTCLNLPILHPIFIVVLDPLFSTLSMFDRSITKMILFPNGWFMAYSDIQTWIWIANVYIRRSRDCIMNPAYIEKVDERQFFIDHLLVEHSLWRKAYLMKALAKADQEERKERRRAGDPDLTHRGNYRGKESTSNFGTTREWYKVWM